MPKCDSQFIFILQVFGYAALATIVALSVVFVAHLGRLKRRDKRRRLLRKLMADRKEDVMSESEQSQRKGQEEPMPATEDVFYNQEDRVRWISGTLAALKGMVEAHCALSPQEMVIERGSKVSPMPLAPGEDEDMRREIAVALHVARCRLLRSIAMTANLVGAIVPVARTDEQPGE